MKENQTLVEYIKANPPKGEFVPSPLYIPEGDVIHYYFSNEPSYNEHVDNHLSLFRTFEGDKIVGVAISGIRECVISAELTKLKSDVERLEAIRARFVMGHIQSICPECGHTNTEDGCAFCIKKAIESFVTKLEAVHESEPYKSVWLCNQIHNGEYKGPFYVDELNALRAFLKTVAPKL